MYRILYKCVLHKLYEKLYKYSMLYNMLDNSYSNNLIDTLKRSYHESLDYFVLICFFVHVIIYIKRTGK